MHRRRQDIFALIIGCLLAVALVVACEFVWRVVKLGSLQLPPSTWTEDPDLIYKLNPESPDSPDSFRGGGPASASPRSLRVLCIGGSSTYGHGVHADEAWPAALQQELQKRGIHAEVLNAGVPGYGVHQNLIRFRRDLWKLGARIVILDEGWNSLGATFPRGRNLFVPGTIARPGASWLRRLGISVMRNSLLAFDLIDATRNVRVNLFETPYEYRLDPDSAAFQDTLRALVNEVLAHDGCPVLIAYPSVYHDDMSNSELAHADSELFKGGRYVPAILDEIDSKLSIVRRVAQETGSMVVDAQDSLRSVVEEGRYKLFLDVAHLTVMGNRVLASMIANRLQASLLVKRSPESGTGS